MAPLKRRRSAFCALPTPVSPMGTVASEEAAQERRLIGKAASCKGLSSPEHNNAAWTPLGCNQPDADFGWIYETGVLMLQKCDSEARRAS
jgi:hypothetical protein